MNKERYAVIIAGILLCAALPCLHAQTVYKWVDENGRMHYGENPPQRHTNLDELTLEAAPAGQETRRIPRFKYTPTQSNKKKKRSQMRKQQRAAQALAEKCANYREKYEHYTSKMRAGYTAKQYDGLEAKRRHYRKQLRIQCR